MEHLNVQKHLYIELKPNLCVLYKLKLMKIEQSKTFVPKFLAGICGLGILATTTPSLAETPRVGQWYYIQARHSGQCLNVLNQGQNNGDNVVQGTNCNNINFQWRLIPAGNGYFFLQARHSGQCLNVLNFGRNNGDNVVQGANCKDKNFQWHVILQTDGYFLLQARNSGQCLNVLNSGRKNGDNVVQGSSCEGLNFQWLFRKV